MDILLQDLAVTGIAIGAAFVLLRRVQGALSSSRKSSACGACPNCGDARSRASAAEAVGEHPALGGSGQH